MGRKLHNTDIYKEPRYLLNKCGITVEDLKARFEDSPCCGVGAGAG